MRPLTYALSTVMAFSLAAIPAMAAELVMVEQNGCHWCAKWNEEISEIYPKTDEGKRAPLRRVDLRNLPDDITFASRPIYTPTFVLMQDGHELGRIEGYPGADFFWPMLGTLLEQHSDATTTPSAAIEPVTGATVPKL